MIIAENISGVVAAEIRGDTAPVCGDAGLTGRTPEEVVAVGDGANDISMIESAGCGIAFLMGEDLETISKTLTNSLAITSGVICDGAKASCAAKIAASVDAGILGYNMFIRGQEFVAGDGIVTKGVEATIVNIGRLGKDGMKGTNEEIIKMMIE